MSTNPKKHALDTKGKIRPRIRLDPFNKRDKNSLNVAQLATRDFKFVAKANGQSSESTPVNTSSFAVTKNVNDFNTRPFNQELNAISRELDSQIEHMIERLSVQKNITGCVSASVISQSLVYAIGRLCRDPDDDNAAKDPTNDDALSKNTAHPDRKVNDWFLHSCQRHGNSLTPLDLSSIDESSKKGLFEGSIVCLRGKNPMGTDFVVTEIIEPPPLKVANVKSTRPQNTEMRILCISSPENATTLHSFLDAVDKFQAAAVVILGPLSTNISENDSVYAELALQSHSKNIPFVVVPSPNDQLTADPLFPQPALDLKQLKQNFGEMVASLSNPCTFCIDEAAITAVNVNVVEDMGISTPLAFKQILRQQQLYPVFPPKISVDIPKLNLTKLSDVSPNIMITPTNLEGGALIVENVMCVLLPKNGFSVLTVHPGTATVATRTSVDFYSYVN